MTDHFAILGEPRRPWINAESLRTRFLTLSADVHPDRVHHSDPAGRDAATRRFAELNAAHAVLRDPKSRLLHLLELETGRRPAGIEQAPQDALDRFLQIGQLCREVDQLKAERERATSPMLKVKSFEQGLELTNRLGQLQATLRAQLTGLEAELQPLNAAWETAPPPGSAERAAGLPLAQIEAIARAWSFASRWLTQLQEKRVQLAV